MCKTSLISKWMEKAVKQSLCSVVEFLQAFIFFYYKILATQPSDDFIHFDGNVTVCGDEETDSDVEPYKDDPG